MVADGVGCRHGTGELTSSQNCGSTLLDGLGGVVSHPYMALPTHLDELSLQPAVVVDSFIDGLLGAILQQAVGVACVGELSGGVVPPDDDVPHVVGWHAHASCDLERERERGRGGGYNTPPTHTHTHTHVLTWACARLWSSRVRQEKFSLGMEGADRWQMRALVLAGLPTTSTCTHTHTHTHTGRLEATGCVGRETHLDRLLSVLVERPSLCLKDAHVGLEQVLA